MKHAPPRSRLRVHSLDRASSVGCVGTTERHGKVKVRLRREDWAREGSRVDGDMRLGIEPYWLLVAVDANTTIELQAGDIITLTIAINKKKHTVSLMLESVENVTEGLRCSGIIHRAICSGTVVD